MTERTKVKFSAEEAALMNDASVILTKNRVIQKVYELFGVVSAGCEDLLRSVSLPDEVRSVPAKISKGENYLGWPYVILDLPRYFSSNDVLAIRTMFWWGHYFSVTLHLKGKYKIAYAKAIEEAYDSMLKAPAFLAITEDEWHHCIDDKNYLLISTLDKDRFKEMINAQSFLKISFKVPMELNEMLEEELLKRIRALIFILDH
jgi:hypothetical protein